VIDRGYFGLKDVKLLGESNIKLTGSTLLVNSLLLSKPINISAEKANKLDQEGFEVNKGSFYMLVKRGTTGLVKEKDILVIPEQ